jgi:predicted extracellular nuclease
VLLGGDGVAIPQPGVAAPGLAGFDPSRWAADAFESLEGMRVAVAEPVVVGPTSRHGELAVLADFGRDAALRTTRGGLRLLDHNPNPQRLLIDDALVARPPQLAVGDALAGPVEGILHYGFGAYKLLNSLPLRALPGGLDRERTELVGGAGQLTVATVNLENLAAVSADERFSRLGAMLADRLRCPDVLALQEVQDDSGPADDGTVSAAATLGRVAAAAAAAGCGRYDWRVIDPVDGSAGGQPGGNIRNAFLFKPARVEFVDRGRCGAADPVRLDPGGGPGCSPGLIDPLDAAFAPGSDGEGGSRRPLVGELRFAGASLVLVNLHLASKGGDDPLFGRRQPPQEGSSTRRTRQAEVVAGFVSELLGAEPGARVLVLGDLNDFEGSPPLATLEAAGLENLVRRLPLADRYSYVFQGNSQVLDHVLASPALAAGAEVDIVHLNAEFPAADRVSDHDPVVVRLSFEP